MQTKLLVTIKKNKEFNLQEFRTHFISELKRDDVNVIGLKKYNDNVIKLPDEFIEYMFMTDHSFYSEDTYENCKNDKIYEELEKVKKNFNDRNKTKVKSIIIVGKPE